MLLPHRLRSALSLGGLPLGELVSRTRQRTREHEILIRASALAYYAMLAAVPSLALILALLVQPPPGSAVAEGEPRHRIAEVVGRGESTLRTLFPREPYAMLKEQVARIQHQPAGVLALGVAVTLWSAMYMFLIIIDAMNRIYGVAETRSSLRLRLTALVMTLVQAAILLGSLAAIVAWPQVLRHLGLDPGGAGAWLATLTKWAAVTAMVLFSFALALYVAPDVRHRWEWTSPGTLAGTLGFLGLSWLFRVYVQNFGSFDQRYGSLGGLMVLALWSWAVGWLLLVAAELNQVIEDAAPAGRAYGQKVDPGVASGANRPALE